MIKIENITDYIDYEKHINYIKENKDTMINRMHNDFQLKEYKFGKYEIYKNKLHNDDLILIDKKRTNTFHYLKIVISTIEIFETCIWFYYLYNSKEDIFRYDKVEYIGELYI